MLKAVCGAKFYVSTFGTVFASVFLIVNSQLPNTLLPGQLGVGGSGGEGEVRMFSLGWRTVFA